MGRDKNSLKRRAAFKSPKKRITVICEGANTEPAYIKELVTELGNAVDVRIERAAGVPMTIARKAIEHLRNVKKRHTDSFQDHDEIWAVFDRDDHQEYEAAVNLCIEKQIGVARSNPCFELWLVLHYQDFDKPVHRHDVQRHLQSLCPTYDSSRGKTPDCREMVKNALAAEARSERQLTARIAEGDPFGCPSTTVHRLTRLIREAAAAFKGAASPPR